MDKKIKKDLVIIAVMLGFIVFAVVKWEIPYFNSLSSSSQSSNNQTKADNSFVSQVNNINNNSTTESVRQDNAIIDGVEYKVNKYNISKHADIDRQLKDVTSAKLEAGTITNEYSFVNVDVTIKNMNKSSMNIDVNTLYINGIENENSKVACYKVTPAYIKNNDIELNEGSFELLQGQSVDITLFYVLNDKSTEEKLLENGDVRFQFIVNPQNERIENTFIQEDERNGIDFIYNLTDIVHE